MEGVANGRGYTAKNSQVDIAAGETRGGKNGRGRVTGRIAFQLVGNRVRTHSIRGIVNGGVARDRGRVRDESDTGKRDNHKNSLKNKTDWATQQPISK